VCQQTVSSTATSAALQRTTAPRLARLLACRDAMRRIAARGVGGPACCVDVEEVRSSILLAPTTPPPQVRTLICGARSLPPALLRGLGHAWGTDASAVRR
jgi:hypothetical protein